MTAIISSAVPKVRPSRRVALQLAGGQVVNDTQNFDAFGNHFPGGSLVRDALIRTAAGTHLHAGQAITAT